VSAAKPMNPVPLVTNARMMHSFGETTWSGPVRHWDGAGPVIPPASLRLSAGEGCVRIRRVHKQLARAGLVLTGGG
jgi:hypothetical protein